VLSLLCQHLHPAIPALSAGVAIALVRSPEGHLTVTVPGTPDVLARLAAAVHDGALILTDTSEPGLAELEALIMADRDRLLAQADALVAEAGRSIPLVG
jgi:hypothetical protein